MRRSQGGELTIAALYQLLPFRPQTSDDARELVDLGQVLGEDVPHERGEGLEECDESVAVKREVRVLRRRGRREDSGKV